MDNGYVDVEHLVVFALLTPLVVFMLAYLVPKMWRAKPDRPRSKPRRWSFRQAMGSGYLRSMPLNGVQLLFLELGGIAGFFEKMLTGTGHRVASTLTLVFGTTFVALLLLWPVVVLFNRPKFIVPPFMRRERGALELWRLSRHGPVTQERD